MTGPANFAWIITALVVLMIPHALARAAAPHDAVKNMPRLTHTSTFTIRSEDQPNNHTYSDNYLHEWRVIWDPAAVQLGSARARYKLNYDFSLSDNLNRIEGSSSDSRFDRFVARLSIDNARALKAFFELEQSDTLNSGNPRTWQSTSVKRANLSFKEEGVPNLSAAYTATTNNICLGNKHTHSSEDAVTQLKADYNHESGRAWQQISALTEMTRSRASLPTVSGTSRHKTVLDAQRRLTLDPLGTLNLGCYYEEQASSNPGATSYQLNTMTQYSLALKGDVRDWPLDYQFNYNVNQRGFSEQAGTENTLRKLRLSFTPPVPTGKTAGMSYEHTLNENLARGSETSIEEQRLIWSLAPNPRTNASAEYGLRQSTNLLSNVRTEENESLKANVVYSIPGNRGQLTGSFGEDIIRKPNTGKRNSSNYINIGSNFNLGPGSNLNLFFNQRYDNDYKSVYDVPGGKDYFLSGVTYRIAGHGLSLEATWKQFYNKWYSGQKKDSQSLNVNLTYQTSAQWVYQLVLDSSGESSSSTSASGYDYRSEDEVRAIVTYSF